GEARPARRVDCPAGGAADRVVLLRLAEPARGTATLTDAGPAVIVLRRGGRAGRRWVERDPADVLEVHLHPRVGVVIADLVDARGVWLRRAGREAGGHPRRDADHPQHHRHRAGELLAVAHAVVEEERLERVL